MNVLKEYIKKGVTMNDDRLKELGDGGYFKELLERIREEVFRTGICGG